MKKVLFEIWDMTTGEENSLWESDINNVIEYFDGIILTSNYDMFDKRWYVYIRAEKEGINGLETHVYQIKWSRK